jgi:hypothetical protein
MGKKIILNEKQIKLLSTTNNITSYYKEIYPTLSEQKWKILIDEYRVGGYNDRDVIDEIYNVVEKEYEKHGNKSFTVNHPTIHCGA